MALVILGTLVAAVLGMWLIGEVKGIRALRCAGVLLPMLAVPFAFQFGSWTGQLTSKSDHEKVIASFSEVAVDRFDAGDVDSVESELRALSQTAREFEAEYGSLRSKCAVGKLNWRFESSVERLRGKGEEVNPSDERP